MNSSYADMLKDLFAEFGVTYYQSEALCKGLGIFYSLASFGDKNDITKPRWEEKLEECQYLTLGIVIEKIKPFLLPELQVRLDNALVKRNYIAHQFWYERAYDMQDEAGVIKLINELDQYRELFEQLDEEILKLTIAKLSEVGVTADVLEAQLQIRNSAEDILLSKPRLSKKMIRIIQAFEFLDNGASALIFLTDDNQYLQLCDVGLGWSNFTEVSPDWKINEVLQPYLPASIVPRPDVVAPWTYEIKLPQNSLLWVKKGSREKTFKWGIKKAPK